MERAREQQAHPHPTWERLLQLARVVARDDVLLVAQAVRQAQEEYWSHGGSMDEYLKVVYSTLAAPEPMRDLHGEDGLMPNEIRAGRMRMTNEDYLWHRLSVSASKPRPHHP